MAPTSATLGLSPPDPAYQKILDDSSAQSPLPVSDIVKLRALTNDRKEAARQQLGGPPNGTREDEITIPVRDRYEISARIYAPDNKGTRSPLFVFFHGGGYCIGSRKDEMATNRLLTVNLGITVVSVEYRLAPEHPFPVAVYDTVDSITWIYSNASSLGCDPAAGFIVGGVSSGGNLANAAIYLNRSSNSPVKITGQFLSVPNLLPPPVVPERYKDEYVSIEQNKGLTPPAPEVVDLFMSAYKPDIKSPLFVPFNHPQGHSGIPPTYFQICGLDCLRDEQLIYERVLREEEGIPTHKHVYSGLPHHFWEFFPQLREQAAKRDADTIEGFRWLLEVTN